MKNIFLLLKNINNYGFGVFLNIIFFELKYFFSHNNINTLHHDSEFTSNYNDTKAKKIIIRHIYQRPIIFFLLLEKF